MKYLNVTQSTLQYIRKKIITGAYEGGARLNENILSTTLGVSRPPIRESFRTLEYEKIVRSIPRKGVFVTELSIDDYKKISEIRVPIELFALDQIQSQTERDLSPLEDYFAAVRKPYLIEAVDDDETGFDVFCKLGQFHANLVECAGNDYLSHFFNSISSNLARYQYVYYACNKNIPQADLDEHYSIYTMMRENKFLDAKNLLIKHLDGQRTWMLRNFSRLKVNTVAPSIDEAEPLAVAVR